jgi:DNA-binding transcriptional ArsR family regulator
MRILKDLVISRVRVKILTLFLLSPNEMFYVRQVVRATKEEINAVRRELSHLQRAGLLKSEPRGNRLYYYVRKDYPLYFQLLEIINKTSGLGGEINRNRRKLGKITFALLSGKFIRHIKRRKNEIDLLVVGDIVIAELEKIVRSAEKKYNREINFTVMRENEFGFRKKRNDPFVKSIVNGSRVMIVGDEVELVS